MQLLEDTSIAITLGDSTCFGITKNNDFIVQRDQFPADPRVINLGRFTKRRAKDLQEFIARLAIHAVDD